MFQCKLKESVGHFKESWELLVYREAKDCCWKRKVPSIQMNGNQPQQCKPVSAKRNPSTTILTAAASLLSWQKHIHLLTLKKISRLDLFSIIIWIQRLGIIFLMPFKEPLYRRWKKFKWKTLLCSLAVFNFNSLLKLKILI